MTVFVQKFKDGNENRFEVFRRSTAPEDSSVAIESTRQAAIATAGQVANGNESIREMPAQNDFGIIREGDVAPGPGDNPGADPAGGFFDDDGFTAAKNENQAPLGSVDDSLDNLFGEPAGEGAEEPSLDDTLDSLFGEDDPQQQPRQGPARPEADAELLAEQDAQPGVIEQGQDLVDRALGPADTDEDGFVQEAAKNPKDLAEKAADKFFVNR
jgi:hypothetical protein